MEVVCQASQLEGLSKYENLRKPIRDGEDGKIK